MLPFLLNVVSLPSNHLSMSCKNFATYIEDAHEEQRVVFVAERDETSKISCKLHLYTFERERFIHRTWIKTNLEDLIVKDEFNEEYRERQRLNTAAAKKFGI